MRVQGRGAVCLSVCLRVCVCVRVSVSVVVCAERDGTLERPSIGERAKPARQGDDSFNPRNLLSQNKNRNSRPGD